MTTLKQVEPVIVREALRERREIALLDVRTEHAFAQGHPLWAANLSSARIAAEAPVRIPRRETPIVVYGVQNGVDLAPSAVEALVSLGYTDVGVLGGGLDGWVDAGGEVFRDVNVPSKAFGELVAAVRHTPSLAAPEVEALLHSGEQVVVADARRFDEFHTMSIPTATSVPGGELVLRIRELAPDPATRVIVNCAGRTRSIIGTQSLINSGLPNPVAALRNGTIGWMLAGQTLDHGATATAPAEIDPLHHALARDGARTIAGLAGVDRSTVSGLGASSAPSRTTYRFDVRTAAEYEAGHLPGFRHTPGGQLVQETDHLAPVRGARIVLADDDGVRAAMTASWLAQMGWEVVTVTATAAELTERGTDTAAVHAVAPDERYRRPYEGTDNAVEQMQAYLDWEYGLVAQLERDGTHNFTVV